MDADDVPEMRHADLSPSLNRTTGDIVDAAWTVRDDVGPGLLEHCYRLCLKEELEFRGHRVDEHVPVAITYRRLTIPRALQPDLVVDGKVVVEVKAVSESHPIHTQQVLTYLRWTGGNVGLLINFNAVPFRSGIHRFLPPPRSSAPTAPP